MNKFILFILVCMTMQVERSMAYEHTPDSAEIEQLRISNAPDSVKIKNLVLYGHSMYMTNPKKALIYGNEAYKLAKESHSGVLTVVAMAVGRFHLQNKDYKQALPYLFEALNGVDSVDRKDKMVHKRFRAEVLMNVGQVYNELMQYDQSMLYYRRALDECVKNNIISMSGVISLNMGTMFQNSRKNDSAIAYYKKALDIGYAGNDSILVSSALINLTSLYNDLGQNAQAEAYGKKMHGMNQVGGENRERQAAYAYAVKGEMAMKDKQWKSAETALLQALDFAEANKEKKLSLYVLKDLSIVYEKTGHPQKALEYERRASSLRDSTYRQNLEQQIAEVSVKFETERKNKQIELLSSQQRLTQLELQKAGLIKNVTIAAMALAVLLSLIFVLNARNKQRLNKKLEHANQELVASNTLLEHHILELAQKNLLIHKQKQEIEDINQALSNYNNKLINENIVAKYEVLKSKVNPHFLFNSLSTLSSVVTESPELALEYIARFSDLYRTILETSETKLIPLREELKIVDGYLYLQLMEYENKLEIDMQVSDAVKELLLPPFAVQMAVENAIKHNVVTSRNKLLISIHAGPGDEIVIKNTLQPKTIKPESTRTGQKNITDRYSLVSVKPPVFYAGPGAYIVTLPLLRAERRPDEHLESIESVV